MAGWLVFEMGTGRFLGANDQRQHSMRRATWPKCHAGVLGANLLTQGKVSSQVKKSA